MKSMINSLFNRQKEKEEVLYNYIEENVSKAKEISTNIDALYTLFSHAYGNISFERFNKLDLYTPYQIADGVMVSIFYKEEETIYMNAYYASETELLFHKHDDADEAIIHVKGDGYAKLLMIDKVTGEKTIKKYNLADNIIVNIDKDTYHSFVTRSDLICIVKLHKHKNHGNND